MTESEICKIIMSMKSKLCELDLIPTTLLKRLLPKCICIITNIVNISLETGQFYSGWKVAVVQPLLKKSGLDPIHKNYRPVSNLTFLSKVIERAMLHQFNNHCNQHNLLPDFQSAYRKNYSTETALIKQVNEILWTMETKSVMAVTILD